MKKIKIPEEIIEICERPQYLDHLEGGLFRVTVQALSGKKWHVIMEEMGDEIWLLEYPPNSSMFHVNLKGLEHGKMDNKQL
jgi:hypothetical protein